MFRVNIKGRLNKIRIPKKNGLLPLYEAVVNSFHSIEELGRKDDGVIKINIKRDFSQEVFDVDKKDYLYPIIGFEIEDNGVGFNKENYESFLTSDSEYKFEKGAKGIGRFVWLKTFDLADIESYYIEDGKGKLRKFKFVLADNPIKDMILEENLENLNKTMVRLIGLKEEYKENLPKDIKNISIKIIEHCLEFFMRDDCPKVILEDVSEKVVLNDLYKDNLAKNMKTEKIIIKGYEFKIVHIKLYDSETNINRVHYCANNREVKNESINKAIVDLNGGLKDGDKEFIYSAYVFGSLFDKLVNDERTDFRTKMLDDMIGLEGGERLTYKDIEEGIQESIKRYLEDYLKFIRENKRERIKDYVCKKNPVYKSVLKYKKEDVEKIKPGLSDEALDLELYKIQQKFKLEVKKQSKEFLKFNKIDDIKNLSEYKKRYGEYIEKENELGKSSLAEYIIHRKLVIDLLENALNRNENNKYVLEEYIHNLIFPMKTVSDDVDYEKHNLWLIDERLAYHYYLASDMEMKKTEVINVDSKNRMDLFIMDKPIALSNDKTKPLNAITIIEFKRPMRDDYRNDNNPIDQLIRYGRAIKKGRELDKNGRKITIAKDSPFYLYVIADITPSLEEIAESKDFVKTPDGMGYFDYNRNLNAYIEIISYEKLLNDSQKRNRILFDKLFEE